MTDKKPRKKTPHQKHHYSTDYQLELSKITDPVNRVTYLTNLVLVQQEELKKLYRQAVQQEDNYTDLSVKTRELQQALDHLLAHIELGNHPTVLALCPDFDKLILKHRTKLITPNKTWLAVLQPAPQNQEPNELDNAAYGPPDPHEIGYT